MNDQNNAHSQFSAYFGFLSEPFAKNIAAKSLFITTQLKALFARLRQLIARRGLALIIPPVAHAR